MMHVLPLLSDIAVNFSIYKAVCMAITYEQYRAMLPVHKHRLDDELEIQAQIMEQLSTEVIRLNARMLECKQALERIEGRLLFDFKDDDGPKLNAAQIDAKIKRDSGRVTAWQAYLQALSDHGKWQGLLDAWRQKGFSIKTLADLYASQYFQLHAHQVRQRNERTGNDPEAQDRIRAELRIASRSAMPASEPEFKATLIDQPIRTRRKAVSD